MASIKAGTIHNISIKCLRNLLRPGQMSLHQAKHWHHVKNSTRSTALKSFEDLGFYCLDNLPPTLIGTFIDLYEQAATEAGGIAVVCDIRSGTLFSSLPREVALLTEAFLLMSREPREGATVVFEIAETGERWRRGWSAM